MRILGLSGSLRQGASNTTLLQAAQKLSPDGVSIELFEEVGALPHFNPDDEATDRLPEVVRRFRARVEAADAVLICSPEYAGGIPGAFKNALDWLVGCMAMVDKPTAAVNASPWSSHAHDALLLVLTMLSARVVREACIAVPLRGLKLDADGIAAHPEIGPSLRQGVEVLARAASRAHDAR